MSETLKQTLDRLEQEIAQLKLDAELSKKQTLNKRTTHAIDIKKEIEKTVTMGFINNIYRNK